jgi:predicted phosphoadenosine phosphosulfate sulfurtransferase
MSILKRPLISNVYEESVYRIERTFNEFEKVYLSFSGGKDSTTMFHVTADVARRMGKRFGLLIVDLEGQYQLTMEHVELMVKEYEDVIDLYWVCLPISLRNAVSVYEPKWICWDEEQQENWIREIPAQGISDLNYFDFFQKGMEFEEFVPLFGEWYAKGKTCACLVGIRTDESLNRFRTIASDKKIKFKDYKWTTKVTESVYNVYPIYDWRTRDIWIYHAKNPNKRINELYEVMHKAGLSIHQMRICQPYGDDQRRGLWLFHLIEPSTWAKVVARVNGANSGALYVTESGNINGYNKITKPNNHTWESFAKMLINSMPEKTKEHYENKILLFQKWWIERGYPEGIPDEADPVMESQRIVPSWRRVCKSLLRNDYWCKGLGFSQHKSDGYIKYLELMKRRKIEWNVNQLKMKI